MCILQLGVCYSTIINKKVKLHHSFFVLHGNGPVLLGMPDCKRLQLLSVNCDQIECGPKERPNQQQSVPNKLKTNKNIILIKDGFFFCMPGKETGTATDT